ncbi:hypothetical protein AAFF_G00397780 [Aldrovandia affinis]|uniref:Uncharacterized protein n=1 Tax=Aldrovandia affinis TaxID=143900 RepID=A0AAD7WKV4_9TELE|nr:hypothetical protein AAFF_G00397780 [Aldrovandia affinis]
MYTNKGRHNVGLHMLNKSGHGAHRTPAKAVDMAWAGRRHCRNHQRQGAGPLQAPDQQTRRQEGTASIHQLRHRLTETRLESSSDPLGWTRDPLRSVPLISATEEHSDRTLCHSDRTL